MPRLHITELDAPPDHLTADLRAQLEAAGFDLDKSVWWARSKRGVVYYQEPETSHTAHNRPLSGVGGSGGYRRTPEGSEATTRG